MRKSKFSDSQIMDALKQAKGGKPVPEVYRGLGISTALILNGVPFPSPRSGFVQL